MKALKNKRSHLGMETSKDRNSDTWFTPIKYIESARKVLGAINLDPFSCVDANAVIKADTFFDESINSLEQSWKAESLFINPPYGRIITTCVDKIVNEYQLGNFTNAIILTNNCSDTKWFNKLAYITDLFCFTDHRIAFYNVDGKNISGNTRGQTFFYIGQNKQGFIEEFSKYGLVVKQMNGTLHT